MNNRFKFPLLLFFFIVSLNSFSAIWGSTKVCAGSSVTYTSDQVVNALSYNWSFTGGWSASSTTNEITVDFGTDSGVLSLNVIRSVGGSITNLLSVDVFLMPKADFIVDKNVVSMFNPQVYFTNTSRNSTSYKWEFGDVYPSNETNPNHYFEETPAKYTVLLIALNEAGCSDTAITDIKVEEDFIYFIPSAFTPNNDKYNQTFQPIVTCGSNKLEYHLSVYNRSEGLVFESYNPQVGWDGTFSDKNNLMEDGIYTWTLDMKDGSNDKSYSLKGHVHLLR